MRAAFGLGVFGMALIAIARPGGPPVLTHQNAPRVTVLASLDQSRQEFGALSGASLVWNFEIAGPAGDAIGTCTTLLSGNKYRCSLTHESSGGLSLGYEVAFNGTVHQLRDGSGVESGISPLVITTNGDVRPCPLGVPPPWTLPWEVVSSDDDACPTCRVRIADLQDATYWNSKTSTMTASQSPDGSIIARVPESTIDGAMYSTVASFP